MRKKEEVYETYEEYKKFNDDDYDYDYDYNEIESEQEHENYFSGFLILCLKVALGAVIGLMFFSEDYTGVILCVGFPVGLTFFNKIVRFNLFGTARFVIVFWVFKVIISAMLGIFALPILLIWYFLHFIEYFQNKREGGK